MYDSFKTKKTLKIGKKTYTYFSFKDAEKNGLKNISSLPFSIKVLLENLIRNEDGTTVSVDDIKDFDNWKSAMWPVHKRRRLYHRKNPNRTTVKKRIKRIKRSKTS